MNVELNDLFVRSDFDNSKILVTFTAPHGCSAVRWQVLDQGKSITAGALESEPDSEARFETLIENFKPWNVNTPHLYTLKLVLVMDGRATEVFQDFGMRKIHTTPDGIYVNNNRFYVRGYIRGLDAHDHPNLEKLPLEEFYAKNIRAAKAYGFNLVRFHSHVPAEEFLRLADTLGLFVHVELRSHSDECERDGSTLISEGAPLDDNEWRRTIRALRNHPSLMVYCIGNEIDNPGTDPRVAHIARLVKQLDSTRLFLDSCGRGEFDRETSDLLVQHMSYFYPFGKNADMFENSKHWLIYGSAKGLALEEKDREVDWTYFVARSPEYRRPVIAHEICHYVALHDVDVLARKFEQAGAPKPWWIAELQKLIKLKRLEDDYPRMLDASRRFQLTNWKLGIEAARRSPLLSGFHLLQLSNTDRYENSNGILDCFDDPICADPKTFKRFNGDTVIMADLPRRAYFEGGTVEIPAVLSHFSPRVGGAADFAFALEGGDSSISVKGGLRDINLDARGQREICRVQVRLPRVEKAQALTLTFTLAAGNGSFVIENSWNLWLYPNRPEELAAMSCTVKLDDINLRTRYPQIESPRPSQEPENLLIVNRFSAQVMRHLANGGDVVMLYRVPETRDRKRPVEKEEYHLPATWDRFKGTIWDRGANCGAFMRPGPIWNNFPNDGFMDLQFHDLVDDCDKIVLDDFPCHVDPIMQGVDKAVRDRMDVFTYGLSEFQPAWTLRKFGYIFELHVGTGRLFVTGLNFLGITSGEPATCALFESIMRYVTSDAFAPKAAISPRELTRYLLEKGRAPRVKERRMTQFWQLDEEPLESRKYWAQSIDYLGEKPVRPDTFLDKKLRAGSSEHDRGVAAQFP